ncbi:MAG: glycosyltransferase family 39 protein, partial [Patescibacteria group bacterium]|nr:glycosyltransferase family 39 protein [Patescibacteria group bacterium]
MQTLSKKKDLLFLVMLALIYFLTRFMHIMSPLIFNDEAIYIRFAQIELTQSYSWLISLSVGRQPLFIWLVSIMLFVSKDPLFASRLVSVLSGFCSLLGLWFVSNELFLKREIAFITALVYIFYPFGLVYDRLGMLESLLGACTIWSFYLAILLAKQGKLHLAYTLGFLLGAGLLTKSNAVFSILLVPLTGVFILYSKKNRLRNAIRWVFFIFLSCLIALILNLIVQLSPAFQAVLGSHQVYIFTAHQLFHRSIVFIVNNFIKNFSFLCLQLFFYLTPIFSLFLVASLFRFPKHSKERFLLWGYFFIPLVLIALFGKSLQIRYIYPFTLPLLILIGESMYQVIFFISNVKLRILNNIFLEIILLCILLFYPIIVCSLIIFAPMHAPIPTFEKNQYFNTGIGWGIPQSVKLFTNLALKGKIYIATDGVQGIIPQALQIYLSKNPNITIQGYFPITDIVPTELYQISR